MDGDILDKHQIWNLIWTEILAVYQLFKLSKVIQKQ